MAGKAMSREEVNGREYLTKQYGDGSNLNARLRLHQRFSTNTYGWHRWVFDQFDLPERCRILELGCGTGALWLENLNRIPEGWEIILSDFSEGMVKQAEEDLGRGRHFEFEVVDAQSTPLPLETESFDAVIANHMLYHLSDRPAALSEVRRILKPGGHFYSAANGARHVIEIIELIRKFDPVAAVRWERGGRVGEPFSLENGEVQLSRWFGEVTMRRYEDGLAVTEVGPLVEYINSGWMDLEGERLREFERFVAREMESSGGVIRISKDSGIFVSVRDSEPDL